MTLRGEHPMDDRLLELAYGELGGAEARALQAHVDGCERCRATVEGIARVRRAVRVLEPVPAPEAGLESLLAYGEQAAAMARGRRRGLRLLVAVTLATAAGLVWLLAPGSDRETSSSLARADRPEVGRGPPAAGPDRPAVAAAPSAPAEKDRARTVAPAAPMASGAPTAQEPARLAKRAETGRGASSPQRSPGDRALAPPPAPSAPVPPPLAWRGANPGAADAAKPAGVAASVPAQSARVGAREAAGPSPEDAEAVVSERKKKAEPPERRAQAAGSSGPKDDGAAAAASEVASADAAMKTAGSVPSAASGAVGRDASPASPGLAGAPSGEGVSVPGGSRISRRPAADAFGAAPPATLRALDRPAPSNRLAAVRARLAAGAVGGERRALLGEACALETQLELRSARASCEAVVREFPGTDEAARAATLLRLLGADAGG